MSRRKTRAGSRSDRLDRASAGFPAEPGPTPLRAGEPADLLGIVPYLLGFHPQESLVVAVISDGRVGMTARLDLAELARPVELADYLMAILARQQASELVMITYSGQPQARELTAALVEELGADVLLDALLVADGRWWSLLCNGSCCPPGGMPYDLASHPLSAAAVYAGLSALPDREALAAQVRGPRPERLPELEVLVLQAGDDIAGLRPAARKKLVRRLVREQVDSGSGLSPLECVRLAVLVVQIQVRDVAWAQLSRERAQEHVDMWRQVVQHSPDRLAPAPLCLLGMSAWVAGQGALQNCCVERALELDPDYSMAWLLSDINRRCLPPAYWDRLARQFRREPSLMTG